MSDIPCNIPVTPGTYYTARRRQDDNGAYYMICLERAPGPAFFSEIDADELASCSLSSALPWMHYLARRHFAGDPVFEYLAGR